MTRITEHIETPLAPAAAFAFIADFANAMHWDPGTVTSERIDDQVTWIGQEFNEEGRQPNREPRRMGLDSVLPARREISLVGDGV